MEHLTKKSYYELLGVEPSATLAEIKKAYKERLLNSHPDKTQRTTSDNIVVELKTAYSVLCNDEARREYDDEVQRRFQKSGLISSGEGLDVVTLDDFVCDVEAEGEDSIATFRKDCPRCTAQDGFVLTDNDLEDNGTPDGIGGYEIILQCSACSLWLKVQYYEDEEEE